MVMDQMLRVQDRRTSAEQRHGELVKLSRDRRWLADDVTFVGAGETRGLAGTMKVRSDVEARPMTNQSEAMIVYVESLS